MRCLCRNIGELTGLQTAAIMVKNLLHFTGALSDPTMATYIVSLCTGRHGEDAWGLATIDNIASRFGALLYEVSYEAHQEVVQNY
jgi:hypothetical protein